MVTTYRKDGWAVQRTKTPDGCIYEYQRQFTLSGAAENFDLYISFPFELNRVEYFSNDATAKSFSERVFTGSADPSSYDEILTLIADINIPNAYVPTGSEGVYTQAPILIRTAVSASTAGKTLTKKIVMKRLG